MKCFVPALMLIFAFGAHAAVDGVVTNQTTGRPQAGATVTLVKLAAGMENLASTKTGAGGAFHFDQDVSQSPHLLQVSYENVTYNKAIPPGTPATGLKIDVFNATNRKGDSKVTQHMVLLEPSASALNVSESVLYNNPGKTTYDDEKSGTLRFYLPPASDGKVQVMVKGPLGMPIPRVAEKTNEPNVYTVKFPIKPGETQFDLTYALPPATSFDSKILHDGGPVRIVAPRGVTLSGDNLKDLGKEPRTQATIYEIAGNQYQVQIAGTGTLRAGAEAAQQPAQEDQGPSIVEAKPHIYDRLPWLLGFAGTILLVGLILLYRAEMTPAASQKKK